jgi:hypothetical protein
MNGSLRLNLTMLADMNDIICGIFEGQTLTNKKTPGEFRGKRIQESQDRDYGSETVKERGVASQVHLISS